MQVSIESSGDITRKLTVTVPADDFKSHYTKRLNQLKKGAKVPGFRPGKAPAKMMEAQFGGQAAREAMDHLINQSYPEAVEQEKLDIAGLISLTPTQFDKEQDFVYEAEVEVYPAIENLDLSGVDIEKPTVDVAEEDIQRTLDNIRTRKMVFSDADKTAEKDDQVVVDFVGTIDGEEFEGGNAAGIEMILGSGQFLPEFEEGVLGAKAGEQVSVEVNFPDDYQGKAVAGKIASFNITVNSVKAGEMPEVTDEFAKELGVAGGKDAMIDEIKKGLNRELDAKMRMHVRDQVLNAAADKVDVTLPETLIKQEVERAIEAVTKQVEEQGMDPAEHVKPENFQDESQRRVKLGLIVRQVMEAEKLEVSDEMIKARLLEAATSYDEPEQYVEYMMTQPEQRQQVAGSVLEDLVVEKLLVNATLKQDTKSYQDFMNG